VVLGTGRKLLDDSVAGAIAGHRVAAPGEVDAALVVGSYPGHSGGMRVLARTADGGQPATLEDVVLGYLASGRGASTDPGRAA
jgi:hypothetical protein